jgi:hypothetical protein
MADFAKAARDAVAELDEPLRTEAFRIILQQLVSGGPSPSAPKADSARPPKEKTPRKKTASGKKEKQLQLPPSTLNLDVNALKTLKAYCDGLDLNGTEQVAFILANFVRQHTDLAVVKVSDIVYLHRMLISQRVKVVAVNDPAHWARALRWLNAPSRRKQWLQASGDGYVVSNSGLLQWNEIEERSRKKRE